MNKLLKPFEYEELCALLSGDEGKTDGISDIEIQHLAWMGAQVPEGGDVVEIGSHRGKSICAIGCGVRYAGQKDVRLFAVDLWTKGVGKTYAHYTTEETWNVFNEQVERMNLKDVVRPVMASSMVAAKRRKRDIDLLFIDASHTYRDVLRDFRIWSKFIPVGGRIAFHDFGTRFKGVERVVREEVMASGYWSVGDIYDRIWSAVRIGPYPPALSPNDKEQERHSEKGS